MKILKSIFSVGFVVLLGFSLPFVALASSFGPDQTVNITYNSSLDTYSAQGTGTESKTGFFLSPTEGLSSTQTDNISTLYTMENTSNGGIVPNHWIAFRNDIMTFKNMYASSGNDSNTSAWTVNITVDGNKNLYRFTFGDSNTSDMIDTGESVNAWIDYNWNGSSNYYIDELFPLWSQNWTFINGWSASGVFAMDGQIASKSAMLLEVQ